MGYIQHDIPSSYQTWRGETAWKSANQMEVYSWENHLWNSTNVDFPLPCLITEGKPWGYCVFWNVSNSFTTSLHLEGFDDPFWAASRKGTRMPQKSPAGPKAHPWAKGHVDPMHRSPKVQLLFPPILVFQGCQQQATFGGQHHASGLQISVAHRQHWGQPRSCQSDTAKSKKQPPKRKECCDNTYHVLNPILNDVWWYQKRVLWNGNKPSRIEVKKMALGLPLDDRVHWDTTEPIRGNYSWGHIQPLWVQKWDLQYHQY